MVRDLSDPLVAYGTLQQGQVVDCQIGADGVTGATHTLDADLIFCTRGQKQGGIRRPVG